MDFHNIFNDAQLAAWVFAALGAGVTAVLAIVTFRQSIEQRKLDLKWRKADLANDFISTLHENEDARHAIEVFDWMHAREKTNDGNEHDLKYEKVLQVLERASRFVQFNGKAYTYLHEADLTNYKLLCAFDWFFFYVDRMEQHITDGLFDFDNVKYIFLPYFEKLANRKNIGSYLINLQSHGATF